MRHISNNTLTIIDRSSNTASMRGPCYEANKLNNLVVTSQSYIEKTKTLVHNNKAVIASKLPEKG